MSFRRRLLVFGYPLLEVLTVVGVASIIGWGWTLLALLAGIPIGVAVMRQAGRSAFAVIRDAAQSGGLPSGEAGAHALTFLAGLLIAVPGFVSDCIGLILLLPPVSRLVRRRYGPRVAAFAASTQSHTATSFGGPDVVIGHVVHHDDAGSPPSDPGPDPRAPRAGYADGPAEAGPSQAIERD